MTKRQIITLGCRLNSYESEIIRSHLERAGLERALVVNSCAVTNEAVRQTRQSLRRARREHPEALLVVTGCAAQIDSAMFERMPEVDFVIGNDRKLDEETWRDMGRGEDAGERVQVGDIFAFDNEKGRKRPLLTGFGGRARAYVAVQNGCDHRCTFCIVPFGRGSSFSIPETEVLAQVRNLVEQGGFAEIVLTGVDIASYGREGGGRPGLGRLCAAILKEVPQLARLRVSSLDVTGDDEEFFALLRDEPRFMPHLHLSLQSGDDLILKRMKRRHDAAGAEALCRKLRELRPGIVLGADFIAGFPTESEEMFLNTMRHIDDCGIDLLHVFPFSPRKGTPAARLPQIDGSIIRERARILRKKGERRQRALLETFVASRKKVLVERDNIGRTEQFIEVELDKKAQSGKLVEVKICGFGENGRLEGVIVQ
jgi:threonylcarbamoyladenosine tRNA methylthiotransferase MtaB